MPPEERVQMKSDGRPIPGDLYMFNVPYNLIEDHLFLFVLDPIEGVVLLFSAIKGVNFYEHAYGFATSSTIDGLVEENEYVKKHWTLVHRLGVKR